MCTVGLGDMESQCHGSVTVSRAAPSVSARTMKVSGLTDECVQDDEVGLACMGGGKRAFGASILCLSMRGK